jgi:hypothetical protein
MLLITRVIFINSIDKLLILCKSCYAEKQFFNIPSTHSKPLKFICIIAFKFFL